MARTEQIESSGARGASVASAFWLIPAPLPPSCLWEELGGPWKKGLLGSPQTQALTSALFLSIPALQDTKNDSSPSISTLATETLLMLDSAVEEPPSGLCLHALYYRLRRAWRRRRTSAL